MDRLEPCPGCQRHVRVSETACPFCGGDVRALAALPSRAMPQARLGRAALFAFGAVAAAATTVACVEEPDPNRSDDEGEEGESGNASLAKDSGASAGGGGATTGGSGATTGGGGAAMGGATERDAGISRFDAGTVVALYGLAVPGGSAGGGQPGGAFIPDAGSDASSNPPKADAGTRDAGRGGDLGGAVALYGLAPAPDSGKPVSLRDAGGIMPLYGLAVGEPDETSS